MFYLSERMKRQFRGTPFERDLRHALKKLSEPLPAVSVRIDAIADFLSVLSGRSRRNTTRNCFVRYCER